MLVVKRKDNQRIIIISPKGERIEVCLVKVLWGCAKIGIVAGQDYKIYREEILPEHLRETK